MKCIDIRSEVIEPICKLIQAFFFGLIFEYARDTFYKQFNFSPETQSLQVLDTWDRTRGRGLTLSEYRSCDVNFPLF